MYLRELLSALHHNIEVSNDSNPMITGISMDNRSVESGNLFVCIKGHRFDGHKFATDAVSKGAVAILAEAPVDVSVPVIMVKDSRRALAIIADVFFGQPSHKLHVVGVTGTNGKTTTTHIIDYICQKANKKTGLIGTMYMKINNLAYDVVNTTPESLTLQKAFYDMVETNTDIVTMEVSSHALDLGRVHGVDFNVAVFTNLTQDHLDYHQTMDEYRRAKGLLFAQLGNTFSVDKPKFAVLNGDDEATAQYTRSTCAHVYTYGIHNDCDIMAFDINTTATGTEFKLKTPFGTTDVSMRLMGQFSIYNVMAAVGACLVSGISLKTIVESIQSFTGVPGRFEAVDAGQDFSVIVDYCHTPDSLENVLKTIQQFSTKKIITVVGCGGDRDKMKRPIMAKLASEYSDIAIFTSDNPRTEDPSAILADMEAGVKGEAFISIVDRKKAIEHAIVNAEQGDIILIAGKGHETYQIIGDKTLPFDDREVAKNAIKEKLM
ncbi:UDP-N-acetylmuramoyl-L-alanyl-D-glutamate--2,6-diaminopimelate ligase [Bacillus sp. HMF5848]|uniref:UDP-N-acetylmuramoyl-L-alanyl-D-glutamate--2, 6-diaminopimelate ligase n=1 Tax=Bacillus sp. HMF5848 TaxID=2495421 RepID=UPI000F79DED5|nr:UDP-N-acetylmuramoyl-L-alanyl-D-glutamate--2,6-diaminopimelate ligase [Bacillus sp. HMF5848]RSK26937.1 UDP-N-acetylmuramoyl-L-alanyl-D-glutamate--2,6-diaminopimelate ligase [Bacillus sp. HMF5848]